MKPLAVVVSPSKGVRDGGVERFCSLITGMLEGRGWAVEETGPTTDGGVWRSRVGLGSLAVSRSCYRGLSRRPDLVFSNGYLGAFAPRGVPRLHTAHGLLIGHVLAPGNDLTPRMKARLALNGGLAEHTSMVGSTLVSVSQLVADEIHRYHRLRVDAVVPNGVDLTRFHPRDKAEARERLGLPADGRLALFVGRLEARKGGPMVVDVCERAGWELVVAGSMAPERGHYLGLLDHDALPWAYAAADAMLFPTNYEGCSYALLEAMACGLPVVTAPVGWMPTLLDAVPQYATLVGPSEPDDLVRRLRDADGDAARDAADLARAHVREHNSLESFSRAWSALVTRAAPEADARALASR